MLQYLAGEVIVIRGKENNILKVKDFRKRNRYPLDVTYIDKVLADEILRIDKTSARLLGSLYKIGQIIDVNEKDVFSFQESESIKYYNSSMVF